MSIESDELQRIATLAKLDIPTDQVAALKSDLDQILDFVEQMSAIDTAAIAPLGNPLESTQRLRPDQVTESNQRERLQSVSQSTEQGLYLVPKVID